jgi:hypothetical protein
LLRARLHSLLAHPIDKRERKREREREREKEGERERETDGCLGTFKLSKI